MNENTLSIKEIQNFVERIGVLKILAVYFTYFATLFFINVGIIMIYDRLFHINFNSQNYVFIVASIFALVTSIDLVLLSREKFTPTMLVWVVIISPILVLYKIFKDTDLFNLNKDSTPARVRKYIFPRTI